MIILLVLIMCGVCAVVGIAAYGAGRNSSERRNGLNRYERKQFRAAEDLIDDLSLKAAEHATLGEPLGVIVLSEISMYRQAIKELP